ncbi:Protein CBR-SRT-70 [Caenorhabditis briggsae]|uniref:Protein CBR-SRT-70 n=1 Tax=Caenorhabditis briggsae TaxID=6238 RepID=A8X7E2_CAEBR|nr:Protein CBR-SRT-70 [Caenorhabditis briggsae]CAP28553.2 Protein CBR-SRT-70 [Caenorhabditis briggsae]
MSSNVVLKLMNIINGLQLMQAICHFLSGPMIVFPKLHERIHLAIGVIGTLLNIGWVGEFPIITILAFCRILIFNNTITLKKMPVVVELMLVLLGGWAIVLFFFGSYFQYVILDSPNWGFNYSLPVMKFVDAQELTISFTCLPLTYLAYMFMAYLIFKNSCLATVLNFTFIYNYFGDKKQRKSLFNLVCVVRAFNNSFILLVAFLGIFLSVTILGHNYFPPILESLSISISLNCNIHNELQGVFMAFNRFFALFFTAKYEKVFNMKITIISHLAIETQTYLVFNASRLAYGGLVDSTTKMSYWAIFYFVVPFAINIPTFFKCYYLRKRLSRDPSENGKHIRRNISEFIQTVFQDSIWQISFVFNMKFKKLSHRTYSISGEYFSTIIDDRRWTFFCQTFIW